MSALASRSARIAAVAAGLAPADSLRRPAAERPTGFPTLPSLIVVAMVTLTGLVARDHVLPGLRPADSTAVALPAGIQTGAVTSEQALEVTRPAPSLSSGRSGEHRSPLLAGAAARKAVLMRQSEERLGKLRHPEFEGGQPPAL